MQMRLKKTINENLNLNILIDQNADKFASFHVSLQVIALRKNLKQKKSVEREFISWSRWNCNNVLFDCELKMNLGYAFICGRATEKYLRVQR